MPLWAKVYWVVAIALFGVWVWRRLRGRAGTSKTSSGGASPLDHASLLDQQNASALDPLAEPGHHAWPAPPPPDPHDDTYRLTPAEAADSSAGPGRGTDRSLDDHLSDDHRSEGQPNPLVGSSGSGATLPELLAGVTLPHELVPLTQVAVGIDLATHVVVATRKATYEVVAEGLTSELERLGYDIDRGSMTELTARGERGVVRVVIHPDGSAVHDAGLRRFPTAEEHTVVVELFAG